MNDPFTIETVLIASFVISGLIVIALLYFCFEVLSEPKPEKVSGRKSCSPAHLQKLAQIRQQKRANIRLCAPRLGALGQPAIAVGRCRSVKEIQALAEKDEDLTIHEILYAD